MERYDADLKTYFRSVAGANLKIDAIETQLSQNIDGLYDANLICSDIKPTNVLIKYRDGPLKVRMADFDANFCCFRSVGTGFSCKRPLDGTLIETAKNATKMQLSWTTFLYAKMANSNVRPVLFRESSRAFLSALGQNKDLAHDLERMHVLETFSHYVFGEDTALHFFRKYDIFREMQRYVNETLKEGKMKQDLLNITQKWQEKTQNTRLLSKSFLEKLKMKVQLARERESPPHPSESSTVPFDSETDDDDDDVEQLVVMMSLLSIAQGMDED